MKKLLVGLFCLVNVGVMADIKIDVEQYRKDYEYHIRKDETDRYGKLNEYWYNSKMEKVDSNLEYIDYAINNYMQYPWFESKFNSLVKTWTEDRRVKWYMVAFCIEEEIKYFNSIQRLYEDAKNKTLMKRDIDIAYSEEQSWKWVSYRLNENMEIYY